MNGKPANGTPSTDKPANSKPSAGRPTSSASAPSTRGPETGTAKGAQASTALAWCARVAAPAVLLCGVAHAPRYRTGPTPGVLTATLLASGSCALPALALLVRASQVRLVAAAAALASLAVLLTGLTAVNIRRGDGT
ncbi:hypothetical protein ABZ865_22245 [Streptomyces sp. NPDC047085]|uniref:hypothetical protein n=1 Tax=Streptomyces sp. NPDC047085 TaxID=3155140 RepID=UPI0033DC3D5F